VSSRRCASLICPRSTASRFGAPTLADAVAAYRASRIDIAEATRVNIGTSLNLITGALDVASA
jgi:hypothetical protein